MTLLYNSVPLNKAEQERWRLKEKMDRERKDEKGGDRKEVNVDKIGS